VPRNSLVRRNLFWGGSTRTPPTRGWAIGPGSGRQSGTALAAPRADDGPAGASAHAQPEAVGPRTTAIVRLEGALHVRAPEGRQRVTSVRDRRPPRHADARAIGALVGSIHGTWIGRAGSNRTHQPSPNPAGRVRTRYPRIPAADRRRRHAENTGESCGQRLMPRAGVVSVAGSTRATTTRSRQRTVSRFRRSGRSCPGRTGDRPDAPHTVDDRVDVSRGAVGPAPFGHRRCRSKDNGRQRD
jgi:hypothetical protein